MTNGPQRQGAAGCHAPEEGTLDDIDLGVNQVSGHGLTLLHETADPAIGIHGHAPEAGALGRARQGQRRERAAVAVSIDQGAQRDIEEGVAVHHQEAFVGDAGETASENAI